MATVLITGASSGLGQEFAWQLASAGHDLVIVARHEERLRTLAEQISAATSMHVEVLPADLATSEGREQISAATSMHVEVLPADLATSEGRAAVVSRLQAGTPQGPHASQTLVTTQPTPVSMLINNAGFGSGTPFLSSTPGHQNTALDVMVRAVMELSHAAATAMRPRDRGAIINVSSVAAVAAMGVYSAHKAWVNSFTEALANELADTNLQVMALAPGLVHTEFHERAAIETDLYPDAVWLDPKRVVRSALADLRRGVVISTPSLRYKSLSILARLAPRSLVRYISRLSRPQYYN